MSTILQYPLFSKGKVLNQQQGQWDEFYHILAPSGNFFVKVGSDPLRLQGEFDALKTLGNHIRVPKPICLDTWEGKTFLVSEFLTFQPLTCQKKLGVALANLHNVTAPKFGFETPNCLGASIQVNTWQDDWITFFKEQRLQNQLVKTQDPFLIESGEKILEKIDLFFPRKKLVPRLLHGDLWFGNVAAVGQTPVVFDPASYFGHAEMELSIMKLFGGFDPSCYESYFSYFPKESGFDERMQLYQLYHVLNHLNLFGNSYRPNCLSLIEELLYVVSP